MLIGNQRHNRYEWLSAIDEALICSFLQGAVYAWCQKHGSEPFAARDFVGDKNYFWQGTPLIVLFNHYYNLYPDNNYAVTQAGRALGHLLKRVIVEDKRTYTTHIAKQVRHYRWDGSLTNDDVGNTPAWLRETWAMRGEWDG